MTAATTIDNLISRVYPSSFSAPSIRKVDAGRRQEKAGTAGEGLRAFAQEACFHGFFVACCSNSENAIISGRIST